MEAAGWWVEVRPADVDETRLPGEASETYVVRLAQAKASAIAADPDVIVLGADTVVVCDAAVLGKPASDAEAVAMLQRLAGREHQVLTGVCLRRGARVLVRVETTQVWFSPLTPSEIAAYVASGEPRDKAGAYAIQGRAGRYIPRIQGSYSNVVGLPLAAVWEMWIELTGGRD